MRTTPNTRNTLLAVVPLVAWVVAGVANASAFIMGNPPTVLGVVSTLLALCAWIATGWFTGAWREVGFTPLALFWIVVLLGAPITSWALNTLPGISASRGGWVLPLILLVLMAPLYGLYALLPAWEPAVQGATIGATGFTVTLAAYFTGRRMGRTAERDVPSRQDAQ